MFVYNIHFNKTKMVKIAFIIVAIILICLFCYVTYCIIAEGTKQENTCEQNPDIIEIDAANYTNVLKEVHDNLDKYINKKIKLSGYIYRVSDFSDTEFVLARDMIISSDLKTLIVGFLCNCNESKKYNDKTWVEVIGTITKGKYHEEIPIINIININTISKPKDAYVYPPDNSFVPTANIF